MIVEWHTHVYPPSQAAAPEFRGRCPMTIGNVLRNHEANGIALTVVTNPQHYLRHMTPAEALASLREWHDYAARLQQDHAGKIICFASAVPCGDAALQAELRRALDELGLRGVFINSSHQGAYPDDDDALPFWETVAARDVPVMVHPPSVGFGEERMRDYRLASSVGRPFDNCLALARLIVRGLFERFPDVKVVGSHLGGGICEIIGRMDYAWELQEEAFFLGPYEPMLIKAPPSHYLAKMHLDMVSYHAPAAMCGLMTMGADRILYGSDAPPLTSLQDRAIRLATDLPISEADRARIMHGNALRLLKLDPSSLRPAA